MTSLVGQQGRGGGYGWLSASHTNPRRKLRVIRRPLSATQAAIHLGEVAGGGPGYDQGHGGGLEQAPDRHHVGRLADVVEDGVGRNARNVSELGVPYRDSADWTVDVPAGWHVLRFSVRIAASLQRVFSSPRPASGTLGPPGYPIQVNDLVLPSRGVGLIIATDGGPRLSRNPTAASAFSAPVCRARASAIRRRPGLSCPVPPAAEE
jgi:hypothetical protein